MPPETVRRIEAIFSKLEPGRRPGSYAIAKRFAPSEGERELIADRAHDLETAMIAARPAVGEQKAEAYPYLAAMFRCFPSLRADDAESDQMIRLYVSQLAGLPIFAIAAACKAMARRDSDWAPSTGRVYNAALAAMAPVASEARKLNAILRAEINTEPELSPEEQAAQREKTEEFLRKLGCSVRTGQWDDPGDASSTRDARVPDAGLTPGDR